MATSGATPAASHGLAHITGRVAAAEDRPACAVRGCPTFVTTVVMFS
ncbi:Uncharacterized protein EbC_pEb17201730 (plasmid) [Erwinia billingiae Eb661]|uniref:Uncharacterized protein n=1 Tax=Erwinia billingiae (strain Eb661) TaxID=634500 RepID=D8MK28_ERWBE|nr:hypothetical protein [Erwinia billingiae]CAX53626.1 Uncharacterized protein EbC_pEb17201730 [Erwinia billingiae Eb661]